MQYCLHTFHYFFIGVQGKDLLYNQYCSQKLSKDYKWKKMEKNFTWLLFWLFLPAIITKQLNPTNFPQFDLRPCFEVTTFDFFFKLSRETEMINELIHAFSLRVQKFSYSVIKRFFHTISRKINSYQR